MAVWKSLSINHGKAYRMSHEKLSILAILGLIGSNMRLKTIITLF